MLNFTIVDLKVLNVIEEVFLNDNISNLLSNFFLQIIVSADFDIYNPVHFIVFEILGSWAFIMSNHENKGIFGFLFDFFDLLLHNFFMVWPS